MEHNVKRQWASFTLKCALSVLLTAFVSIQQSAVDQRTVSYSTALAEHRTIVMADGSELVLNTNSLVSAEVTTRHRSLTVRHGEALLKVAADPRKLVVHLAAIDLEAAAPVRAHFRLDLDGTTRVDMLEGDGWILPAGAAARSTTVLGRFQPIHLKTGSSFSVRDDVRIVEQLDSSEMARRLAWTNGQVILAGDTLSEAVEEFNRYNRRQLVIGDQSIADLPTGGTFYATEVDTFVRSLNQLFRIRAVRMRSADAAADVVVLVGTGYSGL